jgi:hypothetical protein
MHPAELKLYLELPSTENENKNSVVARLIIKSNKELADFKNNQKFKEYLANKRTHRTGCEWIARCGTGTCRIPRKGSRTP